MNRSISWRANSALCLAGVLGLLASAADAETYVTIQPHNSGIGYVVTYSWEPAGLGWRVFSSR